jgi:hypothetical protein
MEIWRIITVMESPNCQPYYQITNDIDIIDYVPERELYLYGLKGGQEDE